MSMKPTAPPTPAPPVTPLVPRPELFWALLIGFVLWLALLWALWLATRPT